MRTFQVHIISATSRLDVTVEAYDKRTAMDTAEASNPGYKAVNASPKLRGYSLNN